jgi:hypothetical protein
MKRLVTVLLLVFVISACSEQKISTPAIPPAIDSHATNTIPPSIATVFPTETLPTPTFPPAPTPNPNIPISEEGPWIFYLDWLNPFITNVDGTGYVEFDYVDHSFKSEAIHAYNVIQIESGKGILAITKKLNIDDPKTYMLDIIPLPDTKNMISVPIGMGLITPVEVKRDDNDYEKYSQYLWDSGVYKSNIAALGELEWSPSGKYLAFTAAIDGPTSDVYVYSVETHQIHRLTDGGTIATNLRWSPDSHYILHTAAISFAGFDRSLDSVWVVSNDGNVVRELYSMDEISKERFIAHEEFYGWYSPIKYLVSHSAVDQPPTCFPIDIVDIDAGNLTNWLDWCISDGAISPEHQVFLFSKFNLFYYSDPEDPDIKIPEGTYIAKIGKEPVRLQETIIHDIKWYPQVDLFLAKNANDQVISVTPDGKITVHELFPEIPTISPSGRYWYWTDEQLKIWDQTTGNLITSPYKGFIFPDENILYSPEQGLTILSFPNFEIINTLKTPHINQVFWIDGQK